MGGEGNRTPDGVMPDPTKPKQAAEVVLRDEEAVGVDSSSGCPARLPSTMTTTAMPLLADLTSEQAQAKIDEADTATALAAAEAKVAVEAIVSIEAPSAAVASVESLRSSSGEALGNASPVEAVSAMTSSSENSVDLTNASNANHLYSDNNVNTNNSTGVRVGLTLDRISAYAARTATQVTTITAATAQPSSDTEWEAAAATAEGGHEHLPILALTRSPSSAGEITKEIPVVERASSAVAVTDRGRDRDASAMTLSSSPRYNYSSSVDQGVAPTPVPHAFSSVSPAMITPKEEATPKVPATRLPRRSSWAAERIANKLATENLPPRQRKNDVLASLHLRQGGRTPHLSDPNLRPHATAMVWKLVGYDQRRLDSASLLAHNSMASTSGMRETLAAVARGRTREILAKGSAWEGEQGGVRERGRLNDDSEERGRPLR